MKRFFFPSLLLLLASSAGATLTPAGTVITNQAFSDTLSDAGTPVHTPSNIVTATVASVCRVRITPDTQDAQGAPGVTTTLHYAVINDGNDTFALSIAGVSDANAAVTVSPASLTLAPAASGNADLSITPAGVGEARAHLIASCANGETASASGTVHAKTLPLSIVKTESKEQVVIGDTLDYTLTVSNPNAVPLTVKVSDTLDSHLSFVGSDPKVDPGSAAPNLSWSGLSVPALGSVVLHVQTKVNDSADEADIPNVAGLEQPYAPSSNSNQVIAHLFDGHLKVVKQAGVSTVRVGQSVPYTITVKNISHDAVFQSYTLTDTLPSGEKYVAGSAQLGGVAQEPVISGQVLTWTGTALKPGEIATLTYRALVTLDATPGSLVNTVVVDGGGTHGGSSDHALAPVEVLANGSLADIIGVVFVDLNNNGEPDRDEPVIPGARILLAGGRETLSDASGRYHFADLKAGRYALYADAASLPLPAAAYPGDQGKQGARDVNALGLTQVNFPLVPPTLNVDTRRFTTLTAGPVTLLKSVLWLGKTQYRSVTTLTTAAPASFTLLDVTPGTVQDVKTGTLLPGVPLSFQTDYTTPDSDPLGDPQLTVTVTP